MKRIAIACVVLFASPVVAEEKPTVTGTVLLDGKALDGATISFYPADATKPAVATAGTDKDGKYKVTLPAGEYAVVVLKAIVVPKSDPPRETIVTPGKYASPLTSGLKVTVKNGANSYNAELKSK
jgi:hypothetical protein